MKPLPVLLRIIGVVQLFFGALFVLAPAHAGDLLGLGTPPPAWVPWLFVMLGARFLGFALGMFRAARAPEEHVGWIEAMVVVQVVDWVGTVAFLLAGDIPLPNVASALLLPVVFVVGLLWWHPRRRASSSVVAA